MEGHDFEKHETPPQPPVDFKSVLERGEILHFEELKGYWGIYLAKIKDDGDAFFRPDQETDFIHETKGVRRSDLENLVFRIDEILEFGIVPPVILRTIENREGSLQRRLIEGVHVASIFGESWAEDITPNEITKAAVLDYLIDAKDRHKGNFMVDRIAKKIWLIDHDYLMFWATLFNNAILDEVRKRNLTVIDGQIQVSLERFLAHVDSLTVGAKSEIIKIIEEAKRRAENLLETGEIPQTI